MGPHKTKLIKTGRSSSSESELQADFAFISSRGELTDDKVDHCYILSRSRHSSSDTAASRAVRLPTRDLL